MKILNNQYLFTFNSILLRIKYYNIKLKSLRNRINNLTVIMLMGCVLAGCQSISTKEKYVRRVLQEEKYNIAGILEVLGTAQQDSIAINKKYVLESEERISDHEKNIAELKELISKENKKNKAKYEIELARFEQNNSDMKENLYKYK